MMLDMCGDTELFLPPDGHDGLAPSARTAFSTCCVPHSSQCRHCCTMAGWQHSRSSTRRLTAQMGKWAECSASTPLQAKALRANAACEHLPRLVASGKLRRPLRYGVTHYLIIGPLARTLVVGELAAWKVLQIFGDFVRAIDFMDKRGWVHRCGVSTL